VKETDEAVPRDLRERTFDFAVRVVRLCQVLDGIPGVSRTLANQLIRSGTSVGANVEEAQASRSPADFIATYSIACREARETLYWLRLVLASGLVAETRVRPFLVEADEIVAILTSIVRTARRNTRQAASSKSPTS
jgi:four helix bundle protein